MTEEKLFEGGYARDLSEKGGTVTEVRVNVNVKIKKQFHACYQPFFEVLQLVIQVLIQVIIVNDLFARLLILPVFVVSSSLTSDRENFHLQRRVIREDFIVTTKPAVICIAYCHLTNKCSTFNTQLIFVYSSAENKTKRNIASRQVIH